MRPSQSNASATAESAREQPLRNRTTDTFPKSRALWLGVNCVSIQQLEYRAVATGIPGNRQKPGSGGRRTKQLERQSFGPGRGPMHENWHICANAAPMAAICARPDRFARLIHANSVVAHPSNPAQSAAQGDALFYGDIRAQRASSSSRSARAARTVRSGLRVPQPAPPPRGSDRRPGR